MLIFRSDLLYADFFVFLKVKRFPVGFQLKLPLKEAPLLFCVTVVTRRHFSRIVFKWGYVDYSGTEVARS